MKFTLPNAILALAIAAQSASAESTCAAQNILEACLDTTKGYLEQCQSTDYGCLCDKWTAIMTCYNNCPNDEGAASDQNQKTLYCMNASLYSSMTAKPVSATSQSAPATAATTTSGDAAQGAQTSSTTSSALPKDTNGAGEMAANRGGVLAAVAGVIAAAAVL